MPALEQFNQFVKTNFSIERQEIINKMFEGALQAETNRRKLTSDELALLDFELKKLCPDDYEHSLILQPHTVVYAVISDPYSHIYALFTTKEKAEAYVIKYNSTPHYDKAVIEVHEADKY